MLYIMEIYTRCLHCIRNNSTIQPNIVFVLFNTASTFFQFLSQAIIFFFWVTGKRKAGLAPLWLHLYRFRVTCKTCGQPLYTKFNKAFISIITNTYMKQNQMDHQFICILSEIMEEHEMLTFEKHCAKLYCRNKLLHRGVFAQTRGFLTQTRSFD